MTKFGKFILFLIIFAVLVLLVFLLQREPKAEAPVVEEPVIEDPVVLDPLPEDYDKSLLLGNVDDLISLSITANSLMPAGILSYRGTIEGGYFFEANILINILDTDKNILKSSNAVATGEWMTSGPVDFEGNIDFTGLSAGAAYFEIHNDNASGLPENDKSILVPIILQ